MSSSPLEDPERGFLWGQAQRFCLAHLLCGPEEVPASLGLGAGELPARTVGRWLLITPSSHLGGCPCFDLLCRLHVMSVWPPHSSEEQGTHQGILSSNRFSQLCICLGLMVSGQAGLGLGSFHFCLTPTSQIRKLRIERDPRTTFLVKPM